jgi:hypothetical protein
MIVIDKKRKDTISVSSNLNTDAEDLKKNIAEVYDFVNDLMAGLPEDVKVSASKVRSVQGTLEYLLNYCWIEDADE